jgi:hypothetical protein
MARAGPLPPSRPPSPPPLPPLAFTRAHRVVCAATVCGSAWALKRASSPATRGVGGGQTRSEARAWLPGAAAAAATAPPGAGEAEGEEVAAAGAAGGPGPAFAALAGSRAQ